eukprot:CAMPEP_0197832010 /NCGR_PEP_ID=MMETSP1437-20131217/12899_1 /TAXON_ID=49252 ORGANISM="Eucampia antarctica, Strain CCMP1452" /NCGR_SAMPLE_ID=MMETSP1437 /ASSEMBLY_ACC=CAM_ASM_001096 /LENGTH=139 /DNA_ID=CAMNT_0043435171 /DNA_START=106 /DNA_END=525 /DNA_ORIENTATION=+
MATGVIVDDDVTTQFNEFKLKHTNRYFIYSIINKKIIKIEKTGDCTKTYQDFMAELPEEDCRYGLIDLEFETTSGRPTSKMIFIAWNPDNAPVRRKMLYAGSKEAIKAALNGVGISINATDTSELDYETAILPVVQKFA